MATAYRLKLKRLDFLSAVDRGAQGPIANAVLLKRAGKRSDVEGTFKVAKTDPTLGLVFGWGFASSLDGGNTPHVDSQADAIDPDFLKACVEFVEGGAATDVMHDGEQDGRVVFAFPLLPDICKALGIETKTVGLAVAIKPSTETFKRFQSGELGAFSIGGIGEREPLTKREKRVIRKDAVLTSLEAGHQHTLDTDAPTSRWGDLQTSYQTAEGATTQHSHAWIFDATTGAVTIAADSGHAHTVDVVIEPAVLAAATAIEADDDEDIAAIPAEIAAEPSDGIPCAVEPEESSGATVNVTIVQARAPQSPTTNARAAEVATRKSPHVAPLPHVDDMKLVVLTESQHAHYSKLAGDDAEAFIAKSASDRDAIVKAALDADPIVFKGEVTGTEVRKSDGPLTKKLAEQNENNAKALAKAQTDMAAEIEKRQVEIYKARAKVELTNAPGTIETHVALLKQIDACPDEATRKAMTATLAGLHAAIDKQTKPAGASVSDPSGSLEAELVAAVTKFQHDNKLPSYEAALAKATGSDAHIRKLYEATAG